MKALRIAAAHILKGLYDTFPQMHSQIKDSLIQKIPQLRIKGVNSLEFIALLSYIINHDIEVKGAKADEKLYKKLTREIYKQVAKTN